MPFRNGQSGNPGGRGSDKAFRRALQLELKEMDGDRTKLRKVAAAVVNAAIGGDMRAAALIADRLDGKPIPQQPDDQPQAEEFNARPQGVNPYAAMAEQYLAHVRPRPNGNRQA